MGLRAKRIELIREAISTLTRIEGGNVAMDISAMTSESLACRSDINRPRRCGALALVLRIRETVKVQSVCIVHTLPMVPANPSWVSVRLKVAFNAQSAGRIASGERILRPLARAKQRRFENGSLQATKKHSPVDSVSCIIHTFSSVYHS